jgi:16S rRNA (cytidine1402-2'-O)-methyltransferase
MNFGVLYLIPTPLGDMNPDWVMPPQAISQLLKLQYLIAENSRTTRRLIARIEGHSPIETLHIFELNKFVLETEASAFIRPLLEGNDMGLLSEAGSPCVADPGALIVKLAHANNIKVVPLVGPSSITLALMASGFNGQNFCFHGYLPIQPAERAKAIASMEKNATIFGQTQIFMETPFRNSQLLETLLKTCHPSTMLSISVNIGMPDEYIKTMMVEAWKKNKADFHKKPAIFLLSGK